MNDPRLSIIERRLERIGRIIAFASGKGGVGKSLCASTAALLLAGRGLRVGLLDLDFHGASDHLILGIDPVMPKEKSGILPLDGPLGLGYMGIAAFTGERGVALRGDAVTDAIRELLAVVVWGELDALFVDMPPGIGEPILDLARHVARSEAVLISTPALLSIDVTRRLGEVLIAGGARLAGCLFNMVRSDTVRGPGSGVAAVAETRYADPVEEISGLRLGRGGAAVILPSLGSIPYLEEMDGQCGSPERILSGRFALALAPALRSLDFPI
jgi:ATP-binding protein involved in chromosome partitioning